MADSAHTRDDAVVIPFTPASAKAARPQKKAARTQKEARTREKKSKVAKAGAGAEASAIDYEKLGIAVEDVPLFEKVRAFFIALGRKRTEEVFECGAVLSQVEEKTPDQKSFEAWTKKACGITRRGAWNYVGVHRRLGRHRDRFVAQSVVASAMYKLIGADDEKIETVISSFEAGTRMTVAQVDAFLKGDTQAEGKTSAADAGGVAGLKAQIAKKVSDGVPKLMDTAAEILPIILAALEPHRRGKRVEKGTAVKKLVLPARLLREQLELLTWVAEQDGDDFSKALVHVQPLSREDRWYELWRMLDKLGGYESWPDAGDVGAWLSETVVPQLEWLLGSRAEKVAAVAAEKEKAAQAEKARVAKEKAKAKAEGQKPGKKADKAKTGTPEPAAADAVGTAEATSVVTAGPGAPTPKKPRTRKAAAQDAVAPEETGTAPAALQAEPIALPAQPEAVAAQPKAVPESGKVKPETKAAVPSPFQKRRGAKQDGTPPASA